MSRRSAGLLILGLIAGCEGVVPEDEGFELNLAPSLAQPVVVGQPCMLLVTLDDAGGNGPVNLTASADGADVVVTPASLESGVVAEIVVTARAGSVGETLQVRVHGERGGAQDVATAGLTVAEGDLQEYVASLEPTAVELRDRFVAWLADNEPELGIAGETAWEGEVVSPIILVVSHYLFFSAYWEMHIDWHVMIPPHDWTQIDLRRRFDEVAPSRSWRIASRSDAGSLPEPVLPPEEVWR